MDISIRPAVREDLETLFTFQTDVIAVQMAAFTPKDPNDKKAYLDKWTKLLNDPTIHLQVIIDNDSIVGSVAKFMMEGEAEITYWIDRPFWGKGIASKALDLFLKVETTRPIFAHVAFDNVGSQKVLEKSNFKRCDQSVFFANARGQEIEEYIYRLDKSLGKKTRLK